MKRRKFLSYGAALGVAGIGSCSKGKTPDKTQSAIPAVSQDKGSELFKLDATAQGQLIAKGKISSAELVEQAIVRAERANADLNFMVTPSFEQARERALKDLPQGPFSGVPTLTKDLLETKGVRSAFGSRAFMNYVPDQNSKFTDVMEQAGLVSIGKSSTPEFGFLPVTEPLAFGPTRNPWNLDHTCGGSSGGAAASVAAGIVAMAQASDGGGSIRIPSNCCGLFGMKSSRGRWPDADGSDWEISVRGYVSRSVRDSQLAMNTMAAIGNGLPSADLASSDRDKKYRIGMRTQTPDGREVHPDCKRAVLLAAKHCQDLGHIVEDVPSHYSWGEFWNAFMTVWAFGAKGAIDGVGQQMGGKLPPRELFEPFSWWLYEQVADKDASAMGSAFAQFAIEREAARKFHKEYDFYLTPVLGEPAIKIGRIDQSGDIGAMRDWLEHYVGFTPWANATGHPAMSVPILRTSANIPVGVQFEGNYGNEANLFELARQLEEIAPWAQDWPDMAAQ